MTEAPRARVILVVDGLHVALQRAAVRLSAERNRRDAEAKAASEGVAFKAGRLSESEHARRAVPAPRDHVTALLAHLSVYGDLEVLDVDAFAPAGGAVSAALGTADTPPGVGSVPGVLQAVLLGMLASAASAMPRRLHTSFFKLAGVA